MFVKSKGVLYCSYIRFCLRGDTSNDLSGIVSPYRIIGLIIYRCVEKVSVGWTSLIATNVLVGGIIIMVVGVVGIYVGNIFMQTKGRPLYVVRQILNDEDKK